MSTGIFIKKTIKYTLLIFALIATMVIIIDPFSRYHSPWFGLAPVETEERTAAVRLARNLEYDTALIGSSMSENFRRSWFEDDVFGRRCIKIPLKGGHYADYSIILNEVLKHPGTKNVVFCLDTYLFTDDFSEFPQTIEEYYVSNIGISDIHYLFNESVIFYYMPMFIITNVVEDFDNDNAYVWSCDYQYSKYAARFTYMSNRLLAPLTENPYDYYFANADVFTDAFIEQIRSHSDVTFYLYVPPYSILFLDDVFLRGNATAMICVQEREYKKLLECDNVRLFYFQNDIPVITDLGNYRDYSHFKQDVNYHMYESMRDGTHELTLDNYYDTLLDFYNFIVSYDYEQCFH